MGPVLENISRQSNRNLNSFPPVSLASDFEFRISNLFRTSNFDLRISFVIRHLSFDSATAL
jgi:hypothetical protein